MISCSRSLSIQFRNSTKSARIRNQVAAGIDYISLSTKFLQHVALAQTRLEAREFHITAIILHGRHSINAHFSVPMLP